MITFYTVAHKRPDFLQLQLDSFRKHIAGGFEFVVFNNAAFDLNRNDYHAIGRVCRANSIRVINVQADPSLVSRLKQYDGEDVFDSEGQYANAVIACAYSLCWAWEQVISRTDDQICIIDSDMFFVEDENPTDALSADDLIYLEHSRGPNGEVYYMWNGLVYMNLANIPAKNSIDWWCGRCEGYPVDVGGHTFHWLRRHRDHVHVKRLSQHHIADDPECDFSPANYEYIGMNGVRSVLHFRGGSGWHMPGDEYTRKKTRWLEAKLHGA